MVDLGLVPDSFDRSWCRTASMPLLSGKGGCRRLKLNSLHRRLQEQIKAVAVPATTFTELTVLSSNFSWFLPFPWRWRTRPSSRYRQSARPGNRAAFDFRSACTAGAAARGNDRIRQGRAIRNRGRGRRRCHRAGRRRPRRRIQRGIREWLPDVRRIRPEPERAATAAGRACDARRLEARSPGIYCTVAVVPLGRCDNATVFCLG